MSPVTILGKSALKVDGSARKVAHDWKAIGARLYLEEEKILLFPQDSRELFVLFILLNSIYCMSSLQNARDSKIDDPRALDTFHRLLSVETSSVNML